MKQTQSNRLIKLAVFSFMIMNLFVYNTFAHEGHNDAFSQDAVDTTQIKKIELTPEGEKAIGLKTQLLKTSVLHQFIQTTGQVKGADNHSFDLSTPISGMVRQVMAKEGDLVKKGQTLAVIQSIEAASILKDLLNQKAMLEKEIAILTSQVALEKGNYEREKALLDEGFTAKKEYLNAENTYHSVQASLLASKKQLQTLLSSAKSQLSVMGVSPYTINQSLASGQVSSNVSIIAPIQSVVSFRAITTGETLQPDKTVFSLIDLSPIWIIVDVFQENIPKISKGLPVRIRTSAGQLIEATVSSIGATVDPEKRTLPVRIVSQNTSGELRPGMSVTAEILYGKSNQNAIVIPVSALVDEQGQSVVYVKYDDYYQPIVVKTGLKTAGEVEITDGLYEGDELVIHGADQLRAHSMLTSKKTGDEKDSDHDGDSSNSNLPIGDFGLGLLVGILGTAIIAYFLLRRQKNREKATHV